MTAPHKKQRFFIAKELRLSISLIVIWSLLAGILFAYLTKELGGRIEFGFLPFAAVFAGYAAVVVIFTIVFTHRFLGPFERLKMEIKLILAGAYHRRLHCRHNDDFYIKSFILEVNKLIDALEKKSFDREGFRKDIDSDLLHLMSLIEKEDTRREKLREAFLSFHEKMESLLGKEK